MSDEWYVGFHEGLVARFWRAAAATMLEADLKVVLGLLPEPPASVLDVPCGDGRLTLGLANAGYAATGIDISALEIEHARERSAGTRFEVGDLRSLPDLGRFDAVLSWGNSFGYTTPAETPLALASLRRALKPGGRLILESLTVAESFLPGGLATHSEYEYGGITMRGVNTYRPEESRYESVWTLTDGAGRVEHASGAHHVHTSGEVVRLLKAAGFRDVELRGPDGRQRYAVGDHRLIAVATA